MTTSVAAVDGTGRISAGITSGAVSLGPLGQLPGTWTGTGYNVIWRPFHGAADHFLQVNLTTETLTVNSIGGAVPNRGLAQGDIDLFGVRYLQQIHDAGQPPDGGGALHIEPGFWLRVPSTNAPQAAESIVRLASIPHGTSVLAQGSAKTVSGPPTIPVESITPFTIGDPSSKVHFPEQTLQPLVQKQRSPVPHNLDQGLLTDPNALLRRRLATQTVLSTTILHVDSQATIGGSAGGVVDIPFLQPNAKAKNVSATFYVETVERADKSTFLQLQYSQRLLLDFATLSWPHLTVGNLILTGA